MTERRKTILVVDDDPNIIDILETTLIGSGYNVVSAMNGTDALNIAESRVVDLIVLDIAMPGMDGMEVCKRLKDMDTARDVPIVFLTAQHELSSKIAAFLCGGRRYITKPFELKHLLDTFSAVLSAVEGKVI